MSEQAGCHTLGCQSISSGTIKTGTRHCSGYPFLQEIKSHLLFRECNISDA